jgi:hypothetical protein
MLMKLERFVVHFDPNGIWYLWDSKLGGYVYTAFSHDDIQREAKRRNQADSPSGFKARPIQEGW